MNRKLTATFATMLIALCLAGVSYAMWSKTLYIDGTVDTGDLDAIITFWFSNDPPGTLDPRPIGATYPAKDVGETVCTIDAVDPQKCYTTIYNGYPCYNVHYTITIMNTGNVAWIMQGIKIDDTTLPNNQWVSFDVDGDGEPDIEFYITDSIGEQVEPGDSIETSLDTHILQTANQGISDRTFTIEVLLVQWKEYQP
ncbi:MAG: hypothetical protein Q6364_14155 [Candidatus Hermodarchaeota archaeon]|nr:hypothetical protein [Candidatus Hermodarchaeota archaeon]